MLKYRSPRVLCVAFLLASVAVGCASSGSSSQESPSNEPDLQADRLRQISEAQARDQFHVSDVIPQGAAPSAGCLGTLDRDGDDSPEYLVAGYHYDEVREGRVSGSLAGVIIMATPSREIVYSEDFIGYYPVSGEDPCVSIRAADIHNDGQILFVITRVTCGTKCFAVYTVLKEDADTPAIREVMPRVSAYGGDLTDLLFVHESADTTPVLIILGPAALYDMQEYGNARVRAYRWNGVLYEEDMNLSQMYDREVEATYLATHEFRLDTR